MVLVSVIHAVLVLRSGYRAREFATRWDARDRFSLYGWFGDWRISQPRLLEFGGGAFR